LRHPAGNNNNNNEDDDDDDPEYKPEILITDNELNVNCQHRQ